VNTGDVAMDLTLGGLEMEPLGPERTRLKGVANMNPNFSWLPDSLLNFIVRKVRNEVCNKRSI